MQRGGKTIGYRVYAGTISKKTETFNGTSALGFQWDTRECIFDSQGDTIEGSVSNRFLEDPVLNLAKNEFGSFEATIPYQINTAFGSYKNPVYTTLKYEKTWLVVEEDGKPIWLGYVTETEKLFDLSYKLYAEGVLGYLQRFVPKVNGGTYYLTTDNQLEQWSSVPSNSIFYLATQALKDYYQGPYGTFGIGKVNIQPGRTIDTSSKGTLFESQWSLLNTFLLEEYDGYLRTRIVRADNGTAAWRVYIDYLVDTDATTTQTIEYGVNLLDFSYVEQMSSDVVTRVTAYGTQTTTSGWWIFKTTTVSAISETVRDEAAEAKYGIIEKCIQIDGNTNSDNLRKEAQTELKGYKQNIEPVMTLTAYDRVDSGESNDRLGFLIKTHIISSPHEIDKWLVCTKLKLPLDAPNEKQFTFGLTPEKLTKQQVQKQAMDSVWTIAQAIISFLNQLLGNLSSS